MVQLYLLGGSLVIAGFVWFWIVRPIAVDLYDAYSDWRDARAELPRDTRDDDETPDRRERPPLPIHLMFSRNTRTPKRTAVLDEPRRSEEIPLLNGLELIVNGSENRAELALNADEVAAVGRMILHNRTAAKPSKSSTISAGFGVSRGGSAAYMRASLIYDTLFGPPAPAVQYRELTPDRQQLLKQKGGMPA